VSSAILHPMFSIDLNCDVGEGMPNDAQLMPYISSANIACGFHAGDERIIKTTIELALKNNVAIGAHPGFPDKANFGRRELSFSPGEIYNIVSDQITLLEKVCAEQGATLNHVKPHGALYNMAARNAEIAHAIAWALFDVNKKAILYGLSGSASITEAKNVGLKTASEVFADRTYQDDGSLTPRSQANALIEDEKASLQQVLQMIKEKTVTTVNSKTIAITAETICLHGDGTHAVEFAKTIYDTLTKNEIIIKAI
jgi:5-oxoprolinase (ATP-hydrolysing) subunit A